MIPFEVEKSSSLVGDWRIHGQVYKTKYFVDSSDRLKNNERVSMKNLYVRANANNGHVDADADATALMPICVSESEEEEERVLSIRPSGYLFLPMSDVYLKIAASEHPLKRVKDMLVKKNVAPEAAKKFCESVAARIESEKLPPVTNINPAVRVAVKDVLNRSLKSKSCLEIHREVCAAYVQGKPYVVVFLGRTGVEMSTSLAKVAKWLLEHDLSVMMAVCGTFSSIDVDELRCHSSRLQIPIYERIGGEDPAIAAKEAIQAAIRNNTRVVLINAASSMQDDGLQVHESVKLIHINNPDLVLYVGEAPGGNDAVDQLSKFSQKLADLSPTPDPRLIDGIFLTKFNINDDKFGAGAVVSMVFILGAPVMFVGCGGPYGDLKKFKVKSVIKALLEELYRGVHVRKKYRLWRIGVGRLLYTACRTKVIRWRV